VPPHLVAPPPGGVDLVVGCVGKDWVRLPPDWNHLAILGRTRTGKSTLAQNLVLQILNNRPSAKVVVVEPTGNLIRGLVERLPEGVAGDVVEIDPAHPTFDQEGQEMAAVPLNLLHLGGRDGIPNAEFERRAERLAGDLLQAVKNAWGEQSVGGRADFILRAVLQGLLSVEGTNLVDAYTVLSDKEALRRLERLSLGSLQKSVLGVHLPRLDYSIKISSLDKVGKVATNPLLRKALCQRFRPVTFDTLLDHRLLLLNLGKDSLGTEGADFLGAIFLTQLWSALQERVRKDIPVYLIVDEFHNFAIPAFADMLSEGARLGLHVVAITQYLSRIPEKVRSALLGNVDAWAFFPVGTEDEKACWAIAKGAQFGWVPEQFGSGLRPHQVAFASEGSLLKVRTYPAPPIREAAAKNSEIVGFSTRRYASREDSEVSPLEVRPDQIAAFLGVFPELEGRTREQLCGQLGWSPQLVDAAIALCKSIGDVIEDRSREVGLSRRGLFHRRAMAAARTEGEDHTSMLTDIATFLDGRGLRVEIGDQRGGYLRPDAEFEWKGQTCSIEVESSSLYKDAGQIVGNVRKALAENRPCLVVVGSRESAGRVTAIIRGAVPRAELWREFGVVWPKGKSEVASFTDGRRPPWSFLLDRPGATPEEEDGGDAEEEDWRPVDEWGVGSPNSGDLALTRRLAVEMLASGRERATAHDFLERVPPDDGKELDARRLGMALSSLGIVGRRIRQEGKQLRPLREINATPAETAGPAPEGASDPPEGSAESGSRI
jgi:hypothetical protein